MKPLKLERINDLATAFGDGKFHSDLSMALYKMKRADKIELEAMCENTITTEGQRAAFDMLSEMVSKKLNPKPKSNSKP